MEDVATVTVAFQEKTQANAISYLKTTVRLYQHNHELAASSFSLSLILFLGTTTSWQVPADY